MSKCRTIYNHVMYIRRSSLCVCLCVCLGEATKLIPRAKNPAGSFIHFYQDVNGLRKQTSNQREPLPTYLGRSRFSGRLVAVSNPFLATVRERPGTVLRTGLSPPPPKWPLLSEKGEHTEQQSVIDVYIVENF